MRRLTALVVSMSFIGCKTVWEGTPRGAFLVVKGGLPKECRQIYEGVRSGILGNVKTWKLVDRLDLSACGVPSKALVDELDKQLRTTREGAANNQKKINELEIELRKAQAGPGQLELEILKNRIRDLESK